MLKQYMSSTHMHSRATWRSCIREAAEMGFDGVELFGGAYASPEEMDVGRLKTLREEAARCAVTLSAHPWVDWREAPQPVLERNVRWMLENCARMGMREVNVHIAFFTDRERGLGRLFSALDPCIPVLEREGITLLFENVPGHGVRELGSEVHDFQTLFCHYGAQTPVMMTVDNGHAHIMGCVRELTERFAERWRYLHVNDNDGLDDLHVRPGAGNVDWDLLAACAKAAGYAGPLMMEYPQDGLRAGVPVVRDAFGRAGYDLARIRPRC